MLLAHEAWFVNTAFGTGSGEVVTTASVLALATPKKIAIVAASAIVLISLVVEEFRTKRERWSKVFAPYLPWAPSVVGALSGVGLILIMARYQAALAPNLLPHRELFYWAALAIGALLVLGMFTRLAALGILVLMALYFVTEPWIVWDLFTNLYWIGLALFLLVAGRGKWSLGSFLSKFFSVGNEHLTGPAVLIFRMLLGASLVALGFGKIAHPEWHELLIQTYQFNPFAILRDEFLPWMSTGGYIFAAGVVEMLLGLLLALGIVIRPIAGLLAVFFIASAVFLGPKELIGHLPLIGSLLGFAIMGRDGVPAKD